MTKLNTTQTQILDAKLEAAFAEAAASDGPSSPDNAFGGIIDRFKKEHKEQYGTSENYQQMEQAALVELKGKLRTSLLNGAKEGGGRLSELKAEAAKPGSTEEKAKEQQGALGKIFSFLGNSFDGVIGMIANVMSLLLSFMPKQMSGFFSGMTDQRSDADKQRESQVTGLAKLDKGMVIDRINVSPSDMDRYAIAKEFDGEFKATDAEKVTEAYQLAAMDADKNGELTIDEVKNKLGKDQAAFDQFNESLAAVGGQFDGKGALNLEALGAQSIPLVANDNHTRRG